jgi:hypothetical protein
MVYRSILTAGCMALCLGVLSIPATPAFANDSGDALEGLPTLDPGQMADFRSKRFEPKWDGVYIPEPKPSKIGKTIVPQFGGDTARPFDGGGGTSHRLPLSGLRGAEAE